MQVLLCCPSRTCWLFKHIILGKSPHHLWGWQLHSLPQNCIKALPSYVLGTDKKYLGNKKLPDIASLIKNVFLLGQGIYFDSPVGCAERNLWLYFAHVQVYLSLLANDNLKSKGWLLIPTATAFFLACCPCFDENCSVWGCAASRGTWVIPSPSALVRVCCYCIPSFQVWLKGSPDGLLFAVGSLKILWALWRCLHCSHCL